SLTSLSMLPGRRVAILGDMKELGPTSPELHRQVGALVGQLGLELLLTAGPEANAIAQGCREGGFPTAVHAFPTKAELLEQLPALIRKDDTVLVKASHSMGFDEVVSALGTLK
ncbi:MAG: UDP-N-acetylmuramoyl-tripeptide--D-alanyl-D-alanine ligase, partial [Oscillospiraceae bacterium]|nr:UDP-N-acetylmuramoyl-tripeptide--D-alanyl-D-alanine ligase [Oscillospiraceae bacterium]